MPVTVGQPLPEAQLVAVDKLVRWLDKTYPTIYEIVGHDDIAPTRKTDPGPAFPMERYVGVLT